MGVADVVMLFAHCSKTSREQRACFQNELSKQQPGIIPLIVKVPSMMYMAGSVGCSLHFLSHPTNLFIKNAPQKGAFFYGLYKI
jgi:hypothetical protein